MLKLYFGSVPNFLSTALFLFFTGYFISTVKKPEGIVKWKKASIITVLIGTAMSAICGIKDSTSADPAVSFKQMNPSLAMLCIMGAAAMILGITAGICKKEKINKRIFFILSFIILAKTIIVEVLRIVKHFN